jgi:hypothetical protein
MAETSRATARISGLPAPTTFSNVWPITRWICNGQDERVQSSDGCDADMNSVGQVLPNQEMPCFERGITSVSPPPTPCVFWDSNSHPSGSFKHYVDMSRYSGLARN